MFRIDDKQLNYFTFLSLSLLFFISSSLESSLESSSDIIFLSWIRSGIILRNSLTILSSRFHKTISLLRISEYLEGDNANLLVNVIFNCTSHDICTSVYREVGTLSRYCRNRYWLNVLSFYNIHNTIGAHF